jgi:hypothetical protein
MSALSWLLAEAGLVPKAIRQPFLSIAGDESRVTKPIRAILFSDAILYFLLNVLYARNN